MNPCSYCGCLGDLDRCMEASCALHDLWYVRGLLTKIAALEARAPEVCPKCGGDGQQECIDNGIEIRAARPLLTAIEEGE